MNKIVLAGLFALFILEVNGQHIKTKTIELKPISYHGGKYYYGFKRVSGGAYGLQIPLQSLDDEEINHRYKSFKTLRTLGVTFSFIPLVYLFSTAYGSHQTYDSKTFWVVWGGSLVAFLTCEITGQIQIRKGIDRYNLLILEPSSNSLGISLTVKF